MVDQRLEEEVPHLVPLLDLLLPIRKLVLRLPHGVAQVFRELRKTKEVKSWPLGMGGGRRGGKES